MLHSLNFFFFSRAGNYRQRKLKIHESLIRKLELLNIRIVCQFDILIFVIFLILIYIFPWTYELFSTHLCFQFLFTILVISTFVYFEIREFNHSEFLTFESFIRNQGIL